MCSMPGSWAGVYLARTAQAVCSTMMELQRQNTDGKQSGPAKGYIEGLEHRLHEAELLLLQLLPAISHEQLSAATAGTRPSHEDHSRGSPNHAGPSVTPPILNKKIGIEYWEQFPLNSPENIRRWQQDCAEGHGRPNPIHSDPARLVASEMSFERSSRCSLEEAAPMKQVHHPSLPLEASASSRRLSGSWPSVYQYSSGVAAGAFSFLQGVDINSMNCSPW